MAPLREVKVIDLTQDSDDDMEDEDDADQVSYRHHHTARRWPAAPANQRALFVRYFHEIYINLLLRFLRIF